MWQVEVSTASGWRAAGRRPEHHAAGMRQRGVCSRVVSGIERTFGDGDPAGVRDERGDVVVGDGVESSRNGPTSTDAIGRSSG